MDIVINGIFIILFNLNVLRFEGKKMGPGHLGIGFAAKSAALKAPLWLLLVASELTDILFYIFVLLGIERKGVDTTDFTNGVQII